MYNEKHPWSGGVELASSTWVGSAEEAENWIGQRPIGESRKAVGQIFLEGIILGVNIICSFNEHSSTSQYLWESL